MDLRLVLMLALLFPPPSLGQELHEGTWGGTLTRVTAVNPRPQRQKFALEFKKAADPHWAWRPEAGDAWTITVISQQGRSQAIGFQTAGDTLSFAFRRADALVRCRLKQQEDSTFVGTCVGEDASRFEASLTPARNPTQ